MKTALFLPLALCAVAFTVGRLHAADPKDPAPPSDRPSREALREQFKNLTPEQRQERLKEMRERFPGITGGDLEKRRAEFEKLRTELKDLPPAERAARIQAWRQTNGFTNGLSRPLAPGLSPEESTAKRAQFRERIDAELTRLKARQADGSITPEETRRLERMSEWNKRLESIPPARGPGPLQRRPSIDEQFPKPKDPATAPTTPVTPGKPAPPSGK